MKKALMFIILGLLLLSTTACGGAANASTTTQTTDSPLTTDYENALPIPLQLVVGTFKLEDTKNLVDAQEASQLLPLWKAVRSLSNNDSTAQEELDALFKQIEETMTPEQIQAIAAMHLTRQDMVEVAQERGLNFGAGARFGNLDPEMQATIDAARQSSEFPQGGFTGGPGGGGVPIPEGGFPGGGPGGGGFQGREFTPEQQATLQARRASDGGANFGFSSAAFDSLIEFLDAKVQ